MHQKQIVIETLPTSNVIIGHHHSFSTYHLYNWYRWSKDGEKIPAIVVGTDAAGIFATNIYNEYCHIYCMLVFDKGLSPYEAMDYIERLVHNARLYAYKYIKNMINYDFKILQPIEFECLSRDLIQARDEVFIESFTEG